MIDRVKLMSTGRASALALVFAIALLPVQPSFAHAPSAPASQPGLATPDEIAVEKTVIGLLRDPELPAVQARAKAYLAQTAIGQTPDGKARIDEAAAQWTNAFLFKVATDAYAPAVIWTTDDTPRSWLGYTLGGSGTSGDNPDHIYRASTLDGSGQYELLGQIDLKHRPGQFVLSVIHAPTPSNGIARKNTAGMDKPIALIDDRDLHLSPDGRFRILIGGAKPADDTQYFALPPGPISVLYRDVFSDWDQRAAKLTIRRIDAVPIKPVDVADLQVRAREGLEPFIRFWSSFPELWLGGLKPNTAAAPIPREGGWGYISGARFQLKPDEAVVVTTSRGGAAYAGIQVVDPWMIASDGRRFLTSFNPSQAKANADGTYSFVISPRDPGVANWLDTAGLQDGFAVLRWQKLPRGANGKGLLLDFHVIKLADAAKLPGIKLITPEQRAKQQAERAITYANRTR